MVLTTLMWQAPACRVLEGLIFCVSIWKLKNISNTISRGHQTTSFWSWQDSCPSKLLVCFPTYHCTVLWWLFWHHLQEQQCRLVSLETAVESETIRAEKAENSLLDCQDMLEEIQAFSEQQASVLTDHKSAHNEVSLYIEENVIYKSQMYGHPWWWSTCQQKMLRASCHETIFQTAVANLNVHFKTCVLHAWKTVCGRAQ